VHYFEDGNVQLNSDKEIPATSVSGNVAESIVKLIKDADHEYQTALNESYAQLSDNTFKALRRILPVTRNKLDWNKILNYKVGNAIAQ
jgi:capping protein alpha